MNEWKEYFNKQRAKEDVKENEKPMRDKGGRFVNGHGASNKSTYDYRRERPKLLCDTCYKNHACPDYHKGYVCLHKREFKRFYLKRDFDYVFDILCEEYEETNINLQKAIVIEIMHGGIDPDVSKFMMKNTRQGHLLLEIHKQIDHEKYINAIERTMILYD